MSSEDCTGIPDNTDITGLGVRLAFYLQVVVSLFVAYYRNQVSDASYWTMLITTFALFVSGLVLHTAQSLSLFHAIIIALLLNLHTRAVFLSASPTPFVRARGMDAGAAFLSILAMSPRDQLRRLAFMRIKDMPSGLIAAIWGVFVWSKPSTFGTPTNCNDKIVVAFLWWKASATGVGRALCLTVSVFQTLIYTVGIYRCIRFYIWDAFADDSETNLPEHWVKPFLRQGFMGGWWDRFWLAAPFGILIAVTELTIKDNRSLIIDQSAENTWTLGQIFPLVMVGVPLVDVVKAFWERHMMSCLDSASSSSF
ncbi:hypothetical protein SISSUDRAFT_1059154 [Sistotremastrum suecicum HHB10207 ss-3]|uniref:Uncharacterized protein n=1 Tax=Sistotremastrum suecicum HHB10207 ss-3 TaxID=1314776 RepID=A0A166GN14_9AGAM|nr:hypothetical protein SISSUDRAFT_1059154 [Sistotremastrum suecicum HHB10207 ss-3]